MNSFQNDSHSGIMCIAPNSILKPNPSPTLDLDYSINLNPTINLTPAQNRTPNLKTISCRLLMLTTRTWKKLGQLFQDWLIVLQYDVKENYRKKVPGP